MKWNNHYNLVGKHAVFGASKSSWLNYDDTKMIESFNNAKACERGTKLHAWAKDTIDLGLKQAKTKNTLNAYVNDAIGFGMSTEVLLYYSEYFFGTADAISFKMNPKTKRNILRIHDLKTGTTKVHMEQLEIYAALFCLEYHYKPGEIDIELRIYQNNEVLVFNPTVEDIAPIMDKIVHFSNILENL